MAKPVDPIFQFPWGRSTHNDLLDDVGEGLQFKGRSYAGLDASPNGGGRLPSTNDPSPTKPRLLGWSFRWVV